MRFFFLLIFPMFANAATIVSGLDDVLRHANNHHFLKAAWKVFTEPDRPYTGMAQAYQALNQQSGKKDFIVLSGMPDWFTTRIEKFLMGEEFPAAQVALRNIFREWSAPDFKLTYMNELMKRFPEEKFIFVFDNSEDSVKTANLYLKTFPHKVAAIYFRMTVSREIPAETFAIFTSFDLAYQELKWNRLRAEDVEAIGELILKEKNGENLIPSYAQCPTTYRACDGATTLKTCVPVQEKIQKLCQFRPKQS